MPSRVQGWSCCPGVWQHQPLLALPLKARAVGSILIERLCCEYHGGGLVTVRGKGRRSPVHYGSCVCLGSGIQVGARPERCKWNERQVLLVQKSSCSDRARYGHLYSAKRTCCGCGGTDDFTPRLPCLPLMLFRRPLDRRSQRGALRTTFILSRTIRGKEGIPPPCTCGQCKRKGHDESFVRAPTEDAHPSIGSSPCLRWLVSLIISLPGFLHDAKCCTKPRGRV
mgnify:CR=1 FL=1